MSPLAGQTRRRGVRQSSSPKLQSRARRSTQRLLAGSLFPPTTGHRPLPDAEGGSLRRGGIRSSPRGSLQRRHRRRYRTRADRSLRPQVKTRPCRKWVGLPAWSRLRRCHRRSPGRRLRSTRRRIATALRRLASRRPGWRRQPLGRPPARLDRFRRRQLAALPRSRRRGARRRLREPLHSAQPGSMRSLRAPRAPRAQRREARARAAGRGAELRGVGERWGGASCLANYCPKSARRIRQLTRNGRKMRAMAGSRRSRSARCGAPLRATCHSRARAHGHGF